MNRLPPDWNADVRVVGPRAEDLPPTAEPVVHELTRREELDQALVLSLDALLGTQDADGHWCFELEADTTISSEYVLMMHFMDEIEEELQGKIATYLRSRQAEHGGWPLYFGGDFDLSCSVKTYWALKFAGDSPDAPHMQRAREAILAHGGAAHCNVFTRIAMALFGEVPWRGVPFVPVEMMLLPRWFPFHLSKVSYWSRTVMVPLSILCSLKARARNPHDVHIRELFTTPPEQEHHYFRIRSPLNRLFLALERTSRLFEPMIPRWIRRRALKRAEDWFVQRLNGEDGLGGIFPAMVNAYESLDRLGYAPDHPYRVEAKKALRRLLVVREDDAYCQPCLSPIWDTALVSLTLQELAREAVVQGSVDPSRNGHQKNGHLKNGREGRASEPALAGEPVRESLVRAHVWLARRQVLGGPADWRDYMGDLKPGAWAFQYNNPHYPDLDDTSVVGWAMQQGGEGRFEESVQRAEAWLIGMRSKDGGYASFDVDNTYFYLNHIPFADHGALLDPPTADVTARCAALFAMRRRPQNERALRDALRYLWSEQEENGSWYGRWGTNYLYGTWSVLAALEKIPADMVDDEHRNRVARAVTWIKSVQRPDGSWGEDCDTYYGTAEHGGHGREGTSFQTAWALLAMMAAGEGDSAVVRRGIDFLLNTQREDGLWWEPWYSAPGFPRVFYLKYHGYSRYFPLWAMARYRNELLRA